MATTISKDHTFLRVIVHNDFLKLIQEYRFRYRYNSVSDAIRSLIKYGLVGSGLVKPTKGVSLEPPFPGAVPEIVGEKLVGWSREM